MPINYVIKLTKQAHSHATCKRVKMHLVEPKDAGVFETLIASDYLEINKQNKSLY